MIENASMPNEMFCVMSDSLLATDPGSAQRFSTKDYEALEKVKFLNTLMIALSRNREVLFQIRQRQGRPRIRMVRYGLGEILFRAIRVDALTVCEHFPFHEFDPLVECFLQHLNADESLISRVQSYHEHPDSVDVVRLVEDLNELANELRLFMAGSEMAIRIKRRKQASRRLYQDSLKHIDNLFERYARLLVVRVDLSFLTPFQCRDLDLSSVTFDDALYYREAFTRSLAREPLFEHLVGYIWKVEQGALKGFHTHWLFFFDGSKVREDITLGHLIGEHWSVIVGPHATYWNCNVNKTGYRYPGIGQIDHADQRKREGLQRAIEYLCKVDDFISLKHTGGRRTFGRSENKPLPNVKRGRPRQQPSVTLDCQDKPKNTRT
jgi:hypothetical protein